MFPYQTKSFPFALQLQPNRHRIPEKSTSTLPTFPQNLNEPAHAPESHSNDTLHPHREIIAITRHEVQDTSTATFRKRGTLFPAGPSRAVSLIFRIFPVRGVTIDRPSRVEQLRAFSPSVLRSRNAARRLSRWPFSRLCHANARAKTKKDYRGSREAERKNESRRRSSRAGQSASQPDQRSLCFFCFFSPVGSPPFSSPSVPFLSSRSPFRLFSYPYSRLSPSPSYVL